MEWLSTLNQARMQGLTSCNWVFGSKDHFSAPPPLLAFVKNANLLNPSLDPSFTVGGRVMPWLMRHGTVEASSQGGADASFLAQQLDGGLDSADSLQTAARVHLAIIRTHEVWYLQV